MADDEFSQHPLSEAGAKPTWDPAAALNDAIASKNLLNVSYEEQTRDILDEAGPAAARSMVNLALYGNGTQRLRAASYILDRQLGRTGDNKPDPRNQSADPLMKLLGDIVKDVEDYANSSHTQTKEL